MTLNQFYCSKYRPAIAPRRPHYLTNNKTILPIFSSDLWDIKNFVYRAGYKLVPPLFVCTKPWCNMRCDQWIPWTRGRQAPTKRPHSRLGTAATADKATMIAVMRIFMTKNITVHFISAENRKRYLSLTPYVIMLSNLCSDAFCLWRYNCTDTFYKCCSNFLSATQVPANPLLICP